MRITIYLFVFLSLSFCQNRDCQNKNCVLALIDINNSKNIEIKCYKSCLDSNIYSWYDNYDDITLFKFLNNFISHTNSNKSYTYFNTILYKDVSKYIKASIILICAYKFSNFNIYFTNCDHFENIVKNLHENKTGNIDVEYVSQLLNELELEDIVFILNYVSFKKDKRFLPVLKNINIEKIKSKNIQGDLMHYEENILEITIDATYGSLLGE